MLVSYRLPNPFSGPGSGESPHLRELLLHCRYSLQKHSRVGAEALKTVLLSNIVLNARHLASAKNKQAIQSASMCFFL